MRIIQTILFLLVVIQGVSQIHEGEKLHQDIVNLEQEKIYLHTDRTNYLTGEILWFKIYTLSSDSGLSKLSKIAYVEILDAENTAVLQAKVKLDEGMGHGSIFIPASLNSGNYRISAYTRWMKNWDPNTFFYQELLIINPFKKITKTKIISKPLYDIQLLPEGGNLVKGLPNRIAVRTTNQNGLGVNYKGVLISESDTIAKFASKGFGLSSFNLQPDTRKFQVLIKPENEPAWIEGKLPSVNENGCTINTSITDNELSITLNSNNPETSYSVIIHQSGKILHRTLVKGDRIIEMRIATAVLRDGINHITILNQSNDPIIERLIFKRPKQKITLNVSNPNEVTSRQPGKIKINSGSLSASANLSLALFHQDTLDYINRINITDYLLFTSELKGTVESPAFYLNDNNQTQELLDLVMLTHGWSRYFSNQKTASTLVHEPELYSHIIKGTILDQNNNPAKNILTFLATPSKYIRVYPAVSDLNGQLSFEMKEFEGSKQVILQTDYRIDSTFHFELINPFADKHAIQVNKSFELAPTLANSILGRSISMQANALYLPSGKIINDTDSITFYGQPDEKYLLDDYTRFPVLEEVLREYVAGVWVRKRNGKFVFQIPDKITGKIIDGEPLVILDGVPQFSINKLFEIDPLKIKQIDVVSRKYYLNGTTFNGIVSLRTYKGDMGGISIDKRALNTNYEGLNLAREFYSPHYDLSTTSSSARIPDRRTLLLWNPEIKLQQGKEVEIDFSSSDIKGNFVIEIQGVDAAGKPITHRSTFTVK